MLDVHPPHESAHSWRDFFVHIATIVVGLLIAVGLEQVVERIHEHYQLVEAREALERELQSNVKKMADNDRNWRRTFAELKSNLLVLRYMKEHPGTKQTELPGDLEWVQSPFAWDHAAWDAAQRDGVVHLMPPDEANRKAEFYAVLQGLSTQSLDDWNAINDAHSFDLIDPDPTHLTPAQLEEVTRLAATAQEKHILMGYSLGRYSNEFTDLPPVLSWGEIEKLRASAYTTDPQGMAAAHAKTQARMDAAAPR